MVKGMNHGDTETQRTQVEKFPTLCLCASVVVFWLCSGCTTIHVTQIDESPDERKITLEIKGRAWFSSGQSIAKIKAIQTDKTQSFGADGITQQGATNSVEALKAIARILELLRPP